MQKETKQPKKFSQQIEIQLVNPYLSSDEDKSDGEDQDIPIKITKRIIKPKLVVDTTELKPKKKVKKIIVADNDKNQDEKEDEKNINKCSQRSLELNEMLFKENSNKNRNEYIKNVWKNLSNYELPNYDKIVIMKSYPGHFVVRGWCSGSIRNPHWLVMDLEGNEFYIMHIKDDIYTKFSKKDLNKVICFNDMRPTWCLTGEYVQCRIKTYENNKFCYLHQYILNVHDKDLTDYTQTVDHINQDKLDNRSENLRLVNMSEQNKNRGKQTRRIDACI